MRLLRGSGIGDVWRSVCRLTGIQWSRCGTLERAAWMRCSSCCVHACLILGVQYGTDRCKGRLWMEMEEEDEEQHAIHLNRIRCPGCPTSTSSASYLRAPRGDDKGGPCELSRVLDPDPASAPHHLSAYRRCAIFNVSCCWPWCDADGVQWGVASWQMTDACCHPT